MRKLIKPVAIAAGTLALTCGFGAPAFAAPVTDAFGIHQTSAGVPGHAPDATVAGGQFTYESDVFTNGDISALVSSTDGEAFPGATATVTNGTVTVVVPEGLAPGHYEVLVVSGDFDFEDETAELPETTETVTVSVTDTSYDEAVEAADYVVSHSDSLKFIAEGLDPDAEAYSATYQHEGADEPTTLSADEVTWSVADGAVEFQWNLNETGKKLGAKLPAGTYTVTVSDGSNEHTVTVDVIDAKAPTFTADVSDFTPGDVVNLTISNMDPDSLAGTISPYDQTTETVGETVTDAKLGEPTRNDDGTFTVAWTTPADLEPGDYALVLVDNTDAQLVIPFEIGDDTGADIAGDGADAETEGLAETGGDSTALLLGSILGVGALAAGGGLLYARRRKLAGAGDLASDIAAE